MGLFTSYFILKGPTQQQVLDHLRGLGRRAAVSITVNGVTVVADEELRGGHVIWSKFETPESYDPGRTGWEPFVADLSEAFQCRVLALEIHDSDIGYYQLHDSDRLIDEYNSRPDYFNPAAFELSALLGGPGGPDHEALRGDASRLCETFDALGRKNEVDEILHNPKNDYGTWTGIFFGIAAGHRLAALIYALGLPPFANHADYYSARTTISIQEEQGRKPDFALTDA